MENISDIDIEEISFLKHTSVQLYTSLEISVGIEYVRIALMQWSSSIIMIITH